MIKIATLKLGALKTNCYLVTESDSEETIIIDPADAAEEIIQNINELEVKPKLVVATHGHFDHNLASLELCLGFDLPFAAHPEDKFLLDKIAQSAAYWLKTPNEPALKSPAITQPLTQDTTIKLGKEEFVVLATPGHTPGSICLYNQKNNLLFSGDTLFKNAVGRTDLSYSSPSDLKKSIQKLMKLPAKTAVYPGHGQPTTIEHEKSWL